MYSSDKDEAVIAIVGMAGRFPGAKDLDTFWHNLRDGVESITFFSDQELEAAGVDPALLRNPAYVKAGSALDDIASFDASFFGYSPKEAEIMDPQQRLFLESSWEALENAGYSSDGTYEGRIGVYAGENIGTYLLFNLFSNRNLLATQSTLQTVIGNDKDYLPTRVSYKLNLKGPSINVNTACSTSLVAVHLACQSLLNGECDMALAGGVNISQTQKSGYIYREGEIASPDGHCRAFDEKAQGTVFGDGVGVVVLKRLIDAREDGDYIHAVIRGSAINNDGAAKVGYTAPSVEGQAEVIAEALALADIPLDTIGYIEAHGTGTSLGDPIEVAALSQVFGAHTQKVGFCALGSVKTNIGHLGAAAGIAGLIKTVLALKYRLVPPSLHFERPNPKIDFAHSPFYVNARLQPWQSSNPPLRAGVSSFGIGGTNAHVVLEEAPARETSSSSRPWQLLLLSAKTPSALDAAKTRLFDYLKEQPEHIADVAYTLQQGRRFFTNRCIILCQDARDALVTLQTRDPQRFVTGVEVPGEKPVVFLFPGQGTQYVHMGRQLYEEEPVFRQKVDHCCNLLKKHLKRDLLTVLYPPSPADHEEAEWLLAQTEITQPALFVIEYALAQLWISWGIQPQAMIGHSLGEYVAACLADVFSLEDALALVALRGQLMQELPAGAMLTVFLPEEKVLPLLNRHLSLAAVNSPALCTIAGPSEHVAALQQQLTDKGVHFHQLHTSHAFHSAMMDPILAAFTRALQTIQFNTPQIPYISNVTGTWISSMEATDPVYWSRHLRQTVLFAQGLQTVMHEEVQILLEVGPGQTLSRLAYPLKGAGQLILQSLQRTKEPQSDSAFLLHTLGQLWLAGKSVNWQRFAAHEQRLRLPLPSYPFERQRYWVEIGDYRETERSQPLQLEQRQNVAGWFSVPSWKRFPLPASTTAQTSQSLQDCYLVFSHQDHLAVGFVERLVKRGASVFYVLTGRAFARCDEKIYCINPSQQDDYIALFQALAALDKYPSRIIYLWSISPDGPYLSDHDSHQLAIDTEFFHLLFLAQAANKQAQISSLHIDIVANYLHSVTGQEVTSAEKALLLGPCKVIPQEYPFITCRCLDIVVPEAGSEQEQVLLDLLCAEFAVRQTAPVVAYRGRYRWIQTFEPVRLEEAEAQQGLREGGVYLITGGLGGIGLTLAHYLADTVHAKLILTGRTTLPEKSQWNQWLATHADHDPTSKKIQAVQALERQGAEVLLCYADVADQTQMASVLAQAYTQFEAIHGVIHAAGIAGGGRIAERTPAEMARVFASKVVGTRILGALFKDTPLDFLVLCSSLSSILGGAGQVDYVAANAFLDAYAYESREAAIQYTVSINWDAWQEVGMSANTEVPDELLSLKMERLKEAIKPFEAIDAFKRILAARFSQVIVSTRDFQTVIQRVNMQRNQGLQEDIQQDNPSRTMYERSALLNAYLAPRNDIEHIIAAIWQEMLGVEKIGVVDNFFALGGHSLLAVQIVGRIREKFQVETPLRDLFEAVTVADLAKVMIANEKKPGQIEKIAHILRQIETMSDEDARRYLQKRKQEREKA